MAAGVFQVTQKVFLVRHGQLLVLRDAGSGAGDLPGGRLEAGELFGDWRDAVARELDEELGPDVRVELAAAPTFWFAHHIQASGFDALGFAWDARWVDGEVVLSEEHEAMAWVDPDTFDPASWFSGPLLAAVERWLIARATPTR